MKRSSTAGTVGDDEKHAVEDDHVVGDDNEFGDGVQSHEDNARGDLSFERVSQWNRESAGNNDESERQPPEHACAETPVRRWRLGTVGRDLLADGAPNGGSPVSSGVGRGRGRLSREAADMDFASSSSEMGNQVSEELGSGSCSTRAGTQDQDDDDGGGDAGGEDGALAHRLATRAVAGASEEKERAPGWEEGSGLLRAGHAQLGSDAAAETEH